MFSSNYSLESPNRCRWTTHSDEPLLFVKRDEGFLDILDVERKDFILKEPIQMDEGMRISWLFDYFFFSLDLSNQVRSHLLILLVITLSLTEFLLPSDFTFWIDVCQSNGNLLASGGDDYQVKIFDKREANIVQTFESVPNRNIL